MRLISFACTANFARRFAPLVAVTIVALTTATASHALPGELDASFGTSGTATITPATGKLAAGNSVVVAGSKVIVGGRVGAAGTVSFSYIEYNLSGVAVSTARIHTKTFFDIAAVPGSNTISATTANPWAPTAEPVMPKFAYDVASGKIVAVGSCSAGTGTKLRPCAVRFNADGSSDLSFGTSGVWEDTPNTLGDTTVASIMIQSDSKILIAATCPVSETPQARRICLYRLNANGTLDSAAFSSIQPVLGASAGSTRANEDVAVDVVQRADGYIAVLGRCLGSAAPGVQKRWNGCISLYDGNWVANATQLVVKSVNFAPQDINTGTLSYTYPSAVVLLSSGNLIAFGGCTQGVPTNTTNSVLAGCATQLTWTGTLFSTIAIDFTNYQGASSTPGVAMTTFDGRPYRDAVLQPNGKPIAVRAKPNAGSCCFYELVRLNTDGSEDSAWTKTAVPSIMATTDTGVPSIAFDNAGRSYSGNHVTSGGNQLVKLSRFQGEPMGCNFDLDGNGGAANAATDGVIALRYLAGYKDPNFTTNAIGVGAARTDYAAINSFITSSCSGTTATSCTLDIDGDNRKLATTDGVLLIRAMLGIPIVTNAIGTGATRNTWALVRNHLANNCGMTGLPPP